MEAMLGCAAEQSAADEAVAIIGMAVSVKRASGGQMSCMLISPGLHNTNFISTAFALAAALAVQASLWLARTQISE